MSSILTYNLRSRSEVYSRNLDTMKYGTETMSYLAPKIWSLVPNAIKSSKSLDVFKSKIRQWEPDCPCWLCKNYLQHVGFTSFSINYFIKSTSNIMYLIRFELMLLSCFCIFRFLAPCIDIRGINCKWVSHLSVTQALGVYESIGEKYIKFQLELYFLFTALCFYSRYLYII